MELPNSEEHTKNHNCIETDKYRHWKEHLDVKMEKRLKNYECPTCGKNLEQKSKYYAHSHVQIQETKADYTNYIFLDSKSKMYQLMKKHTILEKVEACTEQKFCLQGEFPLLSIPPSFHDSEEQYNRFWYTYGDPHPITQIVKVGSSIFKD